MKTAIFKRPTTKSRSGSADADKLSRTCSSAALSGSLQAPAPFPDGGVVGAGAGPGAFCSVKKTNSAGTPAGTVRSADITSLFECTYHIRPHRLAGSVCMHRPTQARSLLLLSLCVQGSRIQVAAATES